MQTVKHYTSIHGIEAKDLEGAPSFDAVWNHLQEKFKNCIFVGHSVKHDLQAMKMHEVKYIDTQRTND